MFRDVILGDEHTNALALYPAVSTEERVGTEQSNHRDTVPNEYRGQATLQEKENVSWADVVRTRTPEQMATKMASDRTKNVVSRELILLKQSRE